MTPTATVASGSPFDGNCRVKRPEHWTKMVHLKQTQPMSMDPSQQGKRICKFDGKCRIKLPKHWTNFKHEKQTKPLT
jgi:hypothetical protein